MATYLQPCHWHEHDVNFKYTVDVFGRTNEGDIARLRLTGFSPYFYLRAEEGETQGTIVQALVLATKKQLNGLRVREEKKLDAMKGFNGLVPTRVWKLSFPAIWMFKVVARELKAGCRIGNRRVMTEDIYEANLPPYLRLFHERDISPASPLKFEADPEDPSEDVRVDVCFSCGYTDIEPFDKISIPLYVLSYDIETYSTVPGQFPVATNPGDEVIQIGMSFRWSDDLMTPVEKYVLVSGPVTPSTDPSVKFVSCKHESDLLLKFQTMIQAENPDIIAGYNTFGFDDGYIAERCQRHKLELQLGRVDVNSYAGDFVKTEKKTFELASGKYAVRYFDLCGRMAVDLLLVTRREQNLDSYKLDSVASTFLRDKVLGVKQLDATRVEIGTKSTRGLYVGNYVRFDVVTNTYNPYQEGAKFQVETVSPKSFTIRTDVPILVELPEADQKRLEWCFSKDDISLEDMLVSHTGTADQRSEVARYCIQDCDLVCTLMAKLDTLVNARGMADVCRVPIDYIFLRGQGIKIFSAVVYTAHKRGQIIMQQESIEGDTSYEGAIVLPPKIGMYLDQPIPVLDFNSLYPSNMIAYNISPDTLAYVKTFNMDGKKIHHEGLDGDELKTIKDAGYVVDEISYDTHNDAGESIGRVTCGFVQPTESDPRTIGLLPLTLDSLLKKRKETRKLMETIEDDAQISVLNGLQLAYKVVANSVYGQTGSRTSPIRKLEVAACTTAAGRDRIILARDVVTKEFGAEVIYGDSVAGNTVLKFLRLNGEHFPMTKIEHIAKKFGDAWIPCSGGKEACETPGLETLTRAGWTPVHRVIRHELHPEKKMYRMRYRDPQRVSAYIDVTDDHSMLLNDGTVISPVDLKAGMKLMSCFPYGLTLMEDPWEVPLIGKYVYDLTTENHHFQAGSLGLVVHNTDSIFIKFPTKDLATAIEMGRQAAERITGQCRRPYKIEYEKTFYPFILFCRKRYVGLMYEDDVTKCKRKTMGIALKRRDNAPIVKDVFGGALDILLEQRDLKLAQSFVKDMLVRLMKNEFPIEKFVVTKQLRDDYKNPDQIAHRVLADRMAERDPGNKPQVGDRIPYVYVATRKGEKKQGDRIEHLEYVKKHNLAPDVELYITNQIQNPTAQLFALGIEQLDGYSPKKNYSTLYEEYRETMDEEDATLAVLKQKEKELETMMFLGAQYLKKHKRGPLDSFFTRM